jgi:hypothetical protein
VVPVGDAHNVRGGGSACAHSMHPSQPCLTTAGLSILHHSSAKVVPADNNAHGGSGGVGTLHMHIPLTHASSFSLMPHPSHSHSSYQHSYPPRPSQTCSHHSLAHPFTLCPHMTSSSNPHYLTHSLTHGQRVMPFAHLNSLIRSTKQ